MTTKDKLMKSALELFQQKWFDNTSTASIAKHAGFATWTLFVHFKSKEELLDSMYISIKKESYSYVFQNLDSSISAWEQLEQVYIKTFQYYVRNYEKLIFIEQFTNSSHIDRVDMSEIRDEMQEYLKILSAAKKDGIVADIGNELLSATIWGLFFSLSKYLNQQWEDRIEECVNIIMNALK